MSASRDRVSAFPCRHPPPIGIHDDLCHEVSLPRWWDVTAPCPSAPLLHEVSMRTPWGRLGRRAVHAASSAPAPWGGAAQWRLGGPPLEVWSRGDHTQLFGIQLNTGDLFIPALSAV